MLFWHLFPGQKEGLFLIDFCYFVNLSTILQVKGIYLQNASSRIDLYLFFFTGAWSSGLLNINDDNLQIFLAPENFAWFTTNYVLCLGCLMNAIVVRYRHISIIFFAKLQQKTRPSVLSCLCQVWQNCLMLHSLDRLTSLFLHALAPLTLHVIRFDKSIVSLTWSWPSSSLSINLIKTINHRRQPDNGNHRRQHHNGHHRRQHHHDHHDPDGVTTGKDRRSLGSQKQSSSQSSSTSSGRYLLNFVESSWLAGTLQTKLLWIITNQWFQTAYLVVTEVFLASWLSKNLDQSFSLR